MIVVAASCMNEAQMGEQRLQATTNIPSVCSLPCMSWSGL
jgi:hypothetical protein